MWGTGEVTTRKIISLGTKGDKNRVTKTEFSFTHSIILALLEAFHFSVLNKLR